MIVKISLVTFILSIAWLKNASGASFSKVFVESDVIPVEYYQYGAPPPVTSAHLSQISAPVGSVVSLSPAPGFVSPCGPPCLLPSETVASIPNANVLTYRNSVPNVPVVVTPTKDEATGYEYSYVVYDENTGDHKAQRELSDGSVVRGEYSFIQPDGYVREVQYVADDIKGFNAVVKNFLPVAVEGEKRVEVKEKKESSVSCHEVKHESLKEGSLEESSKEKSGERFSKHHEKKHKKASMEKSSEESEAKSKESSQESKESKESSESKSEESKEINKEHSKEESSEESKEKHKHTSKATSEKYAKSHEKHHQKHKTESSESEDASKEYHKKESGETSEEQSVEEHEHVKKESKEEVSKESEEVEEKNGHTIKKLNKESEEKHGHHKKGSKEKSGKESEESEEKSKENHKKGSKKESKESEEESIEKLHEEFEEIKEKLVHATHPAHTAHHAVGTEHGHVVPYNDIVHCIQAAINRANEMPAAQREEPSPLTYIILNKPC